MLQFLKQESSAPVLRSVPEVLTSNRLSVTCIPDRLYFVAGKPTRAIQSEEEFMPQPLPLTPHRGGWLSFLSPAELSAKGINGIQPQSTVATDEFNAGNVSLTAGLRAGERERLITRIFNSHLNFFLMNRGLLPLPDSLPPTFYIPSQLIEKDQVSFIDMDERVHRRILVGRSERRQLFWHLGLTARYLVGSNCIQVRLRVVFTVDGAKGTISVDRMKEARRSFCKNWWNDRWRSLELALITWLAHGSHQIELHSGEAGKLVVHARPQQFSMPVSLDEVLISSASDSDVEDGVEPFLTDELDDIDDEDIDSQ